MIFFSIGIDGIELHSTADEARERAHYEMTEARKDAIQDGEWPEYVTEIMWGEVHPREQAACRETDEGEDWTLEEVTDVAGRDMP
jgi:hypothetical protein